MAKKSINSRTNLGSYNNPIPLGEVITYPKNLILRTYPYFDKDYPLSHSIISLESRGGNSIDDTYFEHISKSMDDKDYNLLNNNCSDETARVLNKVFNNIVSTNGLVTPNRVKEAVLSKRNINKTIKQDGNYIRIPINNIEANAAKKQIRDYYDRNDITYIKKLGGNKQLTPNVINGGYAEPLGNNMYYMNGLKHEQGGIDIGKNLEVEDGEVVKTTPKSIKVFSAQPIINGVSPAEAVMNGVNPNKIFKYQEDFKDRFGLKDDGTRKRKAKYI